MKILQVCSASVMGGGEIHVAGLARALADRGHAVYLAVRPGSPLRDALAGVIASWHEMPLRNSLDIQSSRAIADLVQQHNIEIVHAHMGRDYLVAALACRRVLRARFVMTRHHYLPLKRTPIHRWLLAGAAAIIAVSDSVRQSVIEQLGIPAGRVHTIPNWIDPARFRPIDRAAARAMFQARADQVVVCVGQITPPKGQEDFIRAASRVARMRPDVEFLIAGEEYEEGTPFTKHLMRLSEKLGVADKVGFLGYVRHMAELLAAADVVVAPSWDEGFSLVTIEAMAARRTVLASNVGGIRDIVKENVNGMLFPARDEQSLAQKLLWLLSDAALRERLAVQGQQEVYARFGYEQIIDQIEAVYLDVLQDRK